MKFNKKILWQYSNFRSPEVTTLGIKCATSAAHLITVLNTDSVLNTYKMQLIFGMIISIS